MTSGELPNCPVIILYSLDNSFNFFFSSLQNITQFLICKRKLESKKEALLILSKELDACQQERDQYKLMANQLRERHQGLKKKYRELIVRRLCVCWSSTVLKTHRELHNRQQNGE